MPAAAPELMACAGVGAVNAAAPTSAPATAAPRTVRLTKSNMAIMRPPLLNHAGNCKPAAVYKRKMRRRLQGTERTDGRPHSEGRHPQDASAGHPSVLCPVGGGAFSF